jgi:D-glycero-alpha-D-manno-heptose-7-phosphate kinase
MIISKTPLRISFAGGGTDFPEFYEAHGGAVISTTIDKYIYVMVNPSFDGKIRVNYSKKEECCLPESVQHDLVREAMRKVEIRGGVEIATMADVPSQGTGLGSSSALTVGLLNALYRYRGTDLDAETLARTAFEIERQILGAPIGKQDQYIAAYGGMRLFNFHRDGQVTSSTVVMTPSKREALERELMLFFTGITRSAQTVLQEQQQNIKDRTEILLAMRDQVNPMRGVMTDGPRHCVGVLLDEGWRLKRQMAAGVSNPTLHALYEAAIDAGATGGKISGAGGGGFLLLHCPCDCQQQVTKTLTIRSLELGVCNIRPLPFRFETRGSQIILDKSARCEY